MQSEPVIINNDANSKDEAQTDLVDDQETFDELYYQFPGSNCVEDGELA